MIEQSSRGTWWRRIATNLSAIAVGLVAAVLSWRHIVHTAKEYGHEPDWAAMLYPVPIDGMMVVGVVAAADDRATGRKVRPWARVATWVGGILSIANQMASAYVYGATAIAVAVIPSGSLIITVEVMSRRGKLQAASQEASPEPVSANEAPVVPEPAPSESPQPEVPTAEAEVPVVADPQDQDQEEIPDPAPARQRRRPTRRRYPVPSDEVIDATIVELRERPAAVVPAFVGPAVRDPDADME